MAKHALTVVFVAFLATACAGAPLLPQVGQALLKARDFYVGVDRAQGQLEHVVELVCKEPTPEIVNACADAAEGLADADKANDAARNALILAVSAYNVVNGVGDSDAGAP